MEKQTDNQPIQIEQEPLQQPGIPPLVPEGEQETVVRPAHKIRNLFSSKKVLIPTILILLVIVAGLLYLLLFRHQTKNKADQQNTPAANTQSSKNSSATGVPTATVLNGNTYFNSPQKLADLNFMKNTDVFGQSCAGNNGTSDCSPTVKASDISYYQIGTMQDGRKIIMFDAPDGMATIDAFALGNSNGTYAILTKINDVIAQDLKSWQQSLNSKVTLDQTTILNDFSFPANITVNGQLLKSDVDNPNISNSIFMKDGMSSIRGPFYGALKNGNPQKLTTSNNISYYRVVADNQPTFQVVEIFGTLNQLFSTRYVPAGEIASTQGNLTVSWASGAHNLSSYFSGGQGCSSFGYVVATNINKADLISVGRTPKGQTVYQLPTSNALAQELFNKDYNHGSDLDDASLKNLTIQQMTDQHAYFLAQNGFGEYVLFQRGDMFVRGGCAKPVIYLYPQAPTSVAVKVGAQITKSDPEYGSNGWQDVMAYPDGSLKYNGNTYPNLFWEGYGNGAYPTINFGTIVKSQDVLKTVKTQLAQQGLNTKEINDFVTFWGPKLQTDKPYVRISWLGTSQMNQLAPLTVSPLPNTVVRVFMDFKGIDKPYSLAPQKFVTPKRVGFTVVEWGGLMRNGLN